jgi:hypothetical protein
MTTEAIAAPDAAAEIPASEQNVNETPEVTTPESNDGEGSQEASAKPENGDEAEKTQKRLLRRVDRLTAARYEAEAEARQLRERLASYEQRQAPQDHQAEAAQQAIRPEDVEQLAEKRAKQLHELEGVTKRSTEIRDALARAVGAEKLSQVVSAVIEEAGPLANADQTWTPLGEAIADSDSAEKLLIYLAENPDVAESLRGLSAVRLGRRIDAIERQMSEAKVSKAPPPLKPVAARAAPVSKAPEQMTDAEWQAAQRAQRAKRG